MKAKLILLTAVLALCLAAVSNAAQVGDRGRAVWHGQEYDVKVLKVSKDGTKCFITWPGYSSSWDEWRDCSTIRFTGAARPSASYAVGDPVKVQWKGQWYDAKVIAVNEKKNTYKIHYDGYSNSWDEWVTTNRMKSK